MWTHDGIIFSVNHEKKVFRVNTRKILNQSSKRPIKKERRVK